MEICHPVPSCPGPIDQALIQALLTGVEAGVHEQGWGQPALAFGIVRSGADGVELAFHDLPSTDPIDGLYGFVAPDEWTWFGVIAEGHAFPMPTDELSPPAAFPGATAATTDTTSDATPTGATPTEATSGWLLPPGAPPAHVRIAVAVSRTGHQAGLCRVGEAVAVSAEAGQGRVPDVCRRVLGLATTAPERPTADLLARLWLERIFTQAAADPGSVSWPAAIRWHPAVAILTSIDPTLASTLPDHVTEMGNAVSRYWSWSRLRHTVADGLLGDLGVTLDAAGWMDDGIFSREVLAHLPSTRALVDDLIDLVPGPVLDRVLDQLERWSVT